MDAITGISGSIASGQMQLPSLTAAAGGEVTGISAFDSQSIISASSTSISSSVESFIGTYGPLASNNELLGAILLLLMSEYLKGGDEEEKKGILALVAALAQQNQNSGGTGGFVYSESSLSIESSSFQSISMSSGAAPYSGISEVQTVPAADAGAPAIEVFA